MNLHRWDLLLTHATWAELPLYIGAVLVGGSLMMKLMVPLRTLTLLGNLCFVGYAYLNAQYPMLVLHGLLLPINGYRLYQMLKLLRRVRIAAQGDATMALLKPFMKRRRCRAGDALFHKGEVASNMHFIVSGTFRVAEIGMTLQPGRLVGELGLLAPDRRRTQTVECVEDGELLSITYEHVMELFFQDPDFGFHILQLTTSRLFQNLDSLQAQLAAAQKELAAKADSKPSYQPP